MRTISNKKWDELADALEDFLLDELEITTGGAKMGELMRLITGILGIKKE